MRTDRVLEADSQGAAVRAKARKAPGPHSLNPLGEARRMQKRPLQTMVEWQRRYGDVVRFRIGPWHPHLVCHPEGVRQVLQENHLGYGKGPQYDLLKPILGSGLLTSQGPAWLKRRRLIQPVLHRQRIARFAETIVSATEEMLSRWRRLEAGGELLPAGDTMTSLTLDVVSRALLGGDLREAHARISRAVVALQEHVNFRMTHIISLPERYPTPRNRRFQREKAAMDAIVYGLVEKRRAAGAEGDDLLSLLLHLVDEDSGEPLSDLELRDEVMTMLAAGHETTANALAWACYLLARHPAVDERLADEANRVLGERRPAFEDLPRLEYTRRVMEETLRLYPTAWIIGRLTRADDDFDGYRVPANTTVFVSPYVTHRHPHFWPEPERFDPDRFLPEAVAARPRFAYFPFGGGPHQCVGSDFAMMESSLALAMVAREFRFETPPCLDATPEPMVTLRAPASLKLRLQRR